MYVQTRGPLSKTPIQMAFDVAGLEGVLTMERGGGGFGFVDSLSHHPSIPPFICFVVRSSPRELGGSLARAPPKTVENCIMHVVGGSW